MALSPEEQQRLDVLMSKAGGEAAVVQSLQNARAADSGVQPDFLDSFLQEFKSRMPAPFDPNAPKFLQRVGRDLAHRGEQAEAIKQRLRSGQIGPKQAAFQALGQLGYGTGFDVIGEGIVGAGRAARFVPGVDPLFRGAAALLKPPRPIRDAASQVLNPIMQFLGENPNAAANLEAGTNIAFGVLPVPKGAPKTPGRTALGQAGERIEQKATTAAVQKRRDFAQELITPKQTPAVRRDQVGRTSDPKGVLGRQEVLPTPQEQRVVEDILPLEISPKKTLQANFNTIDRAISVEAQALEKQLKDTGIIFPRQQVRAALARKIEEMRTTNPLLTGDAAQSAEKVFGIIDELLDKHPSTPAGLLQVRKELDKRVKELTKKASGKESALFDDSRETAAKIANRELRTTLNDFLAESAPNVQVKESLSRQSNYFKALDAIEDKAANEAATNIGRLIQNVQALVPAGGRQLLTIGAGVGGAGLLFTAYSNPLLAGLVAAGGTAALAARKFILSPEGKKNLGKLIQLTDDAIKATNDKELIKQLRADRAFVLKLLQQNKEEKSNAQNETPRR